MRSQTFILCGILAVPGLMIGCATEPTQNQQATINSGIRMATMAYVLKDGDAVKQQARAMQVLTTTAQVRQQVTEYGVVVPDLNDLAKWANERILANKDVSPEDKRLLQAAMMEAIFLAQNTGLAAANIGAANAATVLTGLDQADRVARTLIGT